MIPVRRYAILSLVSTLAAVGLSACGQSDEEQIRATVDDYGAALKSKDGERLCALLGPPAEAQFTTLMSTFGGADNCIDLVKQMDEGFEIEEQFTGKDIKTARIAIRGDLATLAAKEADQKVGLRKSDGEWRIENLFYPSLHERSRGDARLTRGSDEQQIRATSIAASQAIAGKDFNRICQLMSYRAEAQAIVGGAIASMFATDNGDADADAGGQSYPSCAKAMRAVVSLAQDSEDAGVLFSDLPTRAEVKTARVAVRGAHATITVPGESPESMVKIDGRWLVDAEPAKPEKPVDYERCWRDAGATIATDAKELRFAAGHRAQHIAISGGRISVKGGNWRIFYTLPESGDDPGLSKVLTAPDTVATVAYVKAASTHSDVVNAARDCGQ